MADTVFQVEVGAKYGVSTLRLKDDIQNILNNISKTPPTVTIGVAKTSTERQINQDLNDLFKNNGKAQFGITLGLLGGGNIRGSSGKAITKDLLAITSTLSQQKAAKVTVHIDTEATQKAMMAELKKLNLAVTITGGNSNNTDKQRQKDLQAEKQTIKEMARLRVEQYNWQQKADKAAENSRAKADAQSRANSYESQYSNERDTFLQTDAAKRLGVTSTALDDEVRTLDKVNKAYERVGHTVEVVADRTEKANERIQKSNDKTAQKTRSALFGDAATVQKDIYDTQAELVKTDRGDTDYQMLIERLNRYRTSLAQLRTQANQEFGVSGAAFDKEVSGYEKVIEAAEDYKKACNDAAKAAVEQAEAEHRALVKSAADIQKQIHTSQKEQIKYEQGSDQYNQIQSTIDSKKRELAQKALQASSQFGIPASQFMQEVKGFDSVRNAAEKYTIALQNNVDAKRNKQLSNDERLLDEARDIASATEKYKLKLNEASASAAKYEQELKWLEDAYTEGLIDADKYGLELERWAKRAKDAGAMAESAGERFTRMFSEKIGYVAIALLMNQVKNGLRQIYANVVELDTGMTELKKVTDETDETYQRFLDGAASRAKALGSTMSNVVNATASFARLGYSLDEATELADAAVVYAHVGDEVESIDEASNSVISTMQAFGVEAKDVMSIVDKFNTIGNKFAISSGGAGEAMQRSAAAMQAAGNNIDETLALIASMNTVLQNPESVGGVRPAA